MHGADWIQVSDSVCTDGEWMEGTGEKRCLQYSRYMFPWSCGEQFFVLLLPFVCVHIFNEGKLN